MKTDTPLKKLPFDVVIPNPDGDGIAETVPIEVEAYTDPDTGEDVLTPESLELIERTQARRMGLMLPQEIRELREDRLEVTQEEICELLQIGAKTYTRWETGRARPSRSMNVLLCALRDGVISVEYLRSLRAGVDWEAVRSWRSAPPMNFLAAARGDQPTRAPGLRSQNYMALLSSVSRRGKAELRHELEVMISDAFQVTIISDAAEWPWHHRSFSVRSQLPKSQTLRVSLGSFEPPGAA